MDPTTFAALEFLRVVQFDYQTPTVLAETQGTSECSGDQSGICLGRD